MAVSYFSIFLTALLLGLGWFFVLSILMMLFIKVCEFRKPHLFKLTKAYIVRWLIGSVLAAFTSMYFFWKDAGSTQEHAWMAIIYAMLLWTFLLIIFELFAVKAED